MDWLPTLLAAAGTAPDPGYPPDGINLLPALTGNAAAVDRKLFWRYKGKWQRAARVGDYKFVKILDNTFLFNVVEDPLERANLKELYKGQAHSACRTVSSRRRIRLCRSPVGGQNETPRRNGSD